MMKHQKPILNSRIKWEQRKQATIQKKRKWMTG